VQQAQASSDTSNAAPIAVRVASVTTAAATATAATSTAASAWILRGDVGLPLLHPGDAWCRAGRHTGGARDKGENQCKLPSHAWRPHPDVSSIPQTRRAPGQFPGVTD
jgi:hypothetical protein